MHASAHGRATVASNVVFLDVSTRASAGRPAKMEAATVVAMSQRFKFSLPCCRSD